VNRGGKRPGAMRIALVTAAAAAFTVTAAGCASRSEDSVYCVDQNRRVVDDQYCDDNHPGGGSAHGYYLWHSPGRHYYTPGSIVSGGSLIRTDDTAGRTRVGLPGTGHVYSGSFTRGGFGGGSHSSGG
jgi:hypothetical protein